VSQNAFFVKGSSEFSLGMSAARLDNKVMWNKAKKLWVSLGCLSLLTAFWSAGSLTAAEPEQTIPLADPTIFLDKGTYYLYGTGGLPGSGRDGFLVYTSKDLKSWEGPAGATGGFALVKGDVFGTKWFWAPQIFRYQDRYWIAYAADECIALATSESPLGPFKQEKMEKFPGELLQIDPYIFFDDDGKIYFFHVRLDRGNRIYVAEMEPDLSGIKKDTLRECISTRLDSWENVRNNDYGVAEGPTVIKRDGVYYLFYSANDYRYVEYAVGYATASSPLGPWTRYEGNPILSRKNVGQNGTGHGDILTDPEGKLLYVFHTHKSDKEVHPRKSAVIDLVAEKKEGKTVFSVEDKSFRFLLKK